MKNLYIKIDILYKNDEIKESFYNLKVYELIEFENDLNNFIETVKTKYKDVKYSNVNALMNQRLGKRFFRVDLNVEISANGNVLILLNEFMSVHKITYFKNIENDNNLNSNYEKII